MRENFTIENLKKTKCAHLNIRHFEKTEKPVKKSKYNNKKTVVDEIEFDSIKEANRYIELKLLRKAGVIGFLKLQVPYELNEGGKYSYKYIADFVYTDQKTGEEIVEDCKGALTAVFKKKRRLMKKIFGMEVLLS